MIVILRVFFSIAHEMATWLGPSLLSAPTAFSEYQGLISRAVLLMTSSESVLYAACVVESVSCPRAKHSTVTVKTAYLRCIGSVVDLESRNYIANLISFSHVREKGGKVAEYRRREVECFGISGRIGIRR